jgi:hypothetical protein
MARPWQEQRGDLPPRSGHGGYVLRYHSLSCVCRSCLWLDRFIAATANTVIFERGESR